MFVNNLKIENDSGFALFIGNVSINKYSIHLDRISIEGVINADENLLEEKPTIARILFANNERNYADSLANDNIFAPLEFYYKDQELVVDGKSFSQRTISGNNFSFEIPYTSNLENTKIVISFISSFQDRNEINYYQSSVSTLLSSDLVINKEVSDKTYLPIMFDDKFLLEQTPVQNVEEKPYLSDVFYNLDANNNFSANVFYNVESFFKSRVIFHNLINFPDFDNYFIANYIVLVEPSLLKDENILPLSYEVSANAFLESGKANKAIIVSSPSIDTIKYDESSLNIKFTYNESSTQYIINNVIPLFDNLTSATKEGTNLSSFIRALALYKIARETNSNRESINTLLSFLDANNTITLDKQNVQELLHILDVAKQKYVLAVSNLETGNLANTQYTITSEQKLDLKYNNARVSFTDLISNNSNFPIYSSSSFAGSFTNEVSRFFGTSTPTVDETTIDFNSLRVSFAANTINLTGQETYKNVFDFNLYVSSSISEDVLTRNSYDFTKVLSYFSLGRQQKVVNAYDFRNLLVSSLAYNNLTVERRTQSEIVKNLSSFTVSQRDNVNSYNSFPTNMRNDVCLDNTERQVSENVVARESAEDIPENLLNNISTNYSIKNNNFYSNSYKNVSVSSELPVQVLYPYSQFAERTNTLFSEQEPVVANSKLFSIFYTNFRLLSSVEYLDDLTDGMFATWKPLTFSTINKLAISQRIFCRFSFYRNSEVDILEQDFDQFSIYNKHFYIEAQ